MKNLTGFGKINVGLGILFFVLGTILFFQNLNNAFILKEQFLSLSFFCLGISLSLASFYTKRKS